MQNEIKAPEALFGPDGCLANPGWARKMYFQYDSQKMAAPREKLREWDYYFVGSEAMGISITINNFGGVGMLTAKLLNYKEGYDLKKMVPIRENIHQPKDDEGTCYLRSGDAEGMFIRKPGKHVIKLTMPDYHEGKTYSMDITLQVPDTDRMVIATPFAEGKELRDILWPNNCMVVSYEHEGERHHKLGILPGDVITVHYKTYTPKETAEEIKNLVGKQSEEIEKLMNPKI